MNKSKKQAPSRKKLYSLSSKRTFLLSLIACVFLFSERVGFEPTVTCATLVFKTNTLNHSDISPYFLPYQKQGTDASVVSLGNTKTCEAIYASLMQTFP
jgi:hypothetical protein